MRNRRPYHVDYYMLWNWLLWTATSTKAAISGVIAETAIIPVTHISVITPLTLLPRDETTYDDLVTPDFYWCGFFQPSLYSYDFKESPMLVMQCKKPDEENDARLSLFSLVNLCRKAISHNDDCNSIYAVATSGRKFVCFEYYVDWKNDYKKPKGVVYRERAAKVPHKFMINMPLEKHAKYTEQLAWGLSRFEVWHI